VNSQSHLSIPQFKLCLGCGQYDESRLGKDLRIGCSHQLSLYQADGRSIDVKVVDRSSSFPTAPDIGPGH